MVLFCVYGDCFVWCGCTLVGCTCQCNGHAACACCSKQLVDTQQGMYLHVKQQFVLCNPTSACGACGRAHSCCRSQTQLLLQPRKCIFMAHRKCLFYRFDHSARARPCTGDAGMSLLSMNAEKRDGSMLDVCMLQYLQVQTFGGMQMEIWPLCVLIQQAASRQICLPYTPYM